MVFEKKAKNSATAGRRKKPKVERSLAEARVTTGETSLRRMVIANRRTMIQLRQVLLRTLAMANG
jgi:hypothetical protein